MRHQRLEPVLSGGCNRWIIVNKGSPSRLCISSTERKRSSKESRSVTSPRTCQNPPRMVKKTTIFSCGETGYFFTTGGFGHRHAHVLSVLFHVQRKDLVEQNVVHVGKPLDVAFEHLDLGQLAAEGDGFAAGFFKVIFQDALFLRRFVELLPHHLHQPRSQLADLRRPARAV